MRGMPTIHSSAPSMPRHASSSTSMPLYGRSRPKNSTTGSVRVAAPAAGPPRRPRARCVERAVRDHVHPRRRRTPSSPRQPRAAVLGVHDDGVEALVQPPLRAHAGRAAARAAGCRARSARAAARGAPRDGSSGRRACCTRQPLEVHDVGRARGARGSAACRARARRAWPAARARGRRARAARAVEELVRARSRPARGTAP